MNRIYKWGIIGPGKIAEKFAAALANVPNAELHAVASRDETRARQFAVKYNAKKFYGNYEAIATDPEIDAVYIATPHTFHHAHALLCLENSKPVLCEKPMSVNYKNSMEMVATARRTKTFLMEAMWTRFLPLIDKTLQLIKEGEIGEVKYLRADFGFKAPFDPASRLYDIKLGGGSLLDVGVYPLFLALLILGKPDEIKSFAHLSVTGADETTNAVLWYKNGCMANILSSIVTQTPLTAEISGTGGTIILQRPWYKGNAVDVRKNDTITHSFSLPYNGNGFEFQVMEVLNCLDKGLTESNIMPLDFSLLMSRVVDEICAQCHLHYEI
jgi:predicted dehydrogenase